MKTHQCDVITFWGRVNNFSRDVSDGENYTVLLNQLKPDQCSRAPLQTKDVKTRAEQVRNPSPLIKVNTKFPQGSPKRG